MVNDNSNLNTTLNNSEESERENIVNDLTIAHQHEKEDKKILEVFVHQVSGRAHMLKYDVSTICKSLSVREWRFYSGVLPRLHGFVAKVKGILIVQLDEELGHFKSSGVVFQNICNSKNLKKNPLIDQENYLDDACKINKIPNITSKKSVLHEKNENKNCHEKVLFKGLERLKYEQNSNFTKHPWTVDKDQEAVTEAVGKNPWSLRQHRREIDRILKGERIRAEVDLRQLFDDLKGQSEDLEKEWKEKISKGGDLIKGYLMLEDVTAKFHFPSILDLKIGTQLERLDCSEIKRDKHFNLVQRSSTGSLRLRLAGMQVYQITSEEYLCRDKYYGRGLCKEGFKSIIQQFLHNGRRLLHELISPLVDKLARLKDVLSKMDSYRFYASSVLITYEGDPVLATPESIQVHMIDFAHSTYDGFMEDSVKYAGCDGDCVYALQCLISILINLQNDRSSSSSIPLSFENLSSDDMLHMKAE